MKTEFLSVQPIPLLSFYVTAAISLPPEKTGPLLAPTSTKYLALHAPPVLFVPKYARLNSVDRRLFVVFVTGTGLLRQEGLVLLHI